MSINYVSETPGQRLENTLTGVEIAQKAQREYGNDLPLSFYVQGYKPHTPIGVVCDGMFRAAAMLHRRRSAGTEQSDLLLTRWDADTIRATPTYFAQLQEAFDRNESHVWMAYPYMQSSRIDNDKYPTTNRLLTWFDLAQRAGKSASPSHISMNLGGFALGGGFLRDDYGEHVRWLMRAQSEVGPQNVTRDHLQHAVATTSAHSIVERLADGDGVRYLPLRTDPERSQTEVLPTKDIDHQGQRYESDLRSLVGNVICMAYRDRLYELTELQGLSRHVAEPQAKVFAARYVQIGAHVLGEPQEHQSVIAEAVASEYSYR
ncbi:MAG TPA: hypothetical protein VD735_05980 [Candidatus Saccharimonadales bacterium]|nr:hypothetical protein [Candidatus Saccharimonadales bacterium]